MMYIYMHTSWRCSGCMPTSTVNTLHFTPIFFTLYTHDCSAKHSSNTIIKFADDTTVIGKITNNDEGAYREEVELLAKWCTVNNLSLNVNKTKELIVNFRRGNRVHAPLSIEGATVEKVSSFRFLGVHISEDLTWSLNTSHIIRKAQQRLHFLRRLRSVDLPQQLLCNFYRATVESILTSCITVWYGSATAAEHKALQRVVKSAQHITATTLPSIHHLYNKRCLRKAISISSDPTHPSHFLFQPLPSRKKFLSDRILKAARVVFSALMERNPGLIRDRKHHLKTYRQCCSGKELVDWLIKLNDCFQSRSQAAGMWQVLVDEGILVHMKQELNFHDKDTQFYRFMETEFDLNPSTNEKDSKEDELQEGLALLVQMGPDALLNMILRKCPSQRSSEDVEVIYEELLHVKAVGHLSTSVRKELAAVLVFESHAKAGTVLFSQGDKGTSWYIIWKGSVNVITHGKGLVTTLHEGDDFGQLALVNDAPRAATIILREDNCHFLRVDKQDFIRILKDVEANTVRLEEHGKVVLVLEKSSGQESPHQGGSGSGSKYTVMSGTPEKILEHLLETIKLDTNGSEPIDPCVSDFLLTQQVFMPSAQLCPALQHHYHAEPSEGSELEKATYALYTKQKIVKLVGQWVALYGPLLKEDPVACQFLEKLREEVMADLRLSSMLKEQLRDRRKNRVLENGCQTLTKLNQKFDWFAAYEEPLGKCEPIRAQDKVLYEIFKPDHNTVTLMLPVNSSVKDILSAVAEPGDHVLVKMNSTGDRVQLKLEATAVSTSLGLNERLFLCTASQVEQLEPLKEQLGPEQSTIDTLEQMCSKDIASQLTNYDWELFTAMHEVELVYYVFGRNKFAGVTTANLERFVRRFNEVQYWVVTELCLCEDLMKRALMLKKLIKIATVLKEQKNLNSFFAVMFGLSNSAVHRLYKTWDRIPSKTKRIYCAYERLLDPSRNHRAYRLAVAKLNPPYIPFMPLLLKDMTFIHEGNKNYTDSLVNFEKMRMIAKTVKIVRGCRSQPYVPSSPQKGLTERMFLEAPAIRISTYSDPSLTLRSVANIRHYIQNLKVIDNQKKLTQLSRAIEH